MVPPAAPPAAAARANNSAPGWFEGAPVSKVLTAQVLLVYFLQYYLHIHLTDHDNEPTASIAVILSRLILQKLTFASTGQLLVGTALLAMFLRKFERELGSVRFLWMVLVVSALVVSMEFLSINIVNHYGYDGPYQLLGACLWLYYRYSPRLYPNFVSVLGLSASEKFPAALSKQVSSLLLNIQSPPRVLISVGGAQGPRAAGMAHAAAAAAMAPRPAPRPVQADPAAVEQLVMMGFDQDQVVRVLQATNNNVQRAADQLLSQLS